MSLRKVGDGRIERSGFWIFGTWRIFVTKTQHFALGRREYAAARRRLAAHGVAPIGHEGDRSLWRPRASCSGPTVTARRATPSSRLLL